ncbi:MAG: hypothetical protein ACETV1_08690 [Candidatus Bathyarchaeia archaeon]
MSEKIWKIIKANLLDTRLVSVGFLLLAVVFLDLLFLHVIIPELDTLEHLLFGFVLSEFANNTASSMALEELLTRKLGQKDSQRVNLLIRLLGFLLIGGLLWEASERFVFPLFGSTPGSFFSFPITPTNIDGTIDVTVGAVGCFMAWYLAKSRPLHTSKLAQHS